MAASTYVWGAYFEGKLDGHAYYKLDALETLSTALLHPFLYFYFKSLTDEHPISRKEYLWLTPALFVGLGTLTLYLLMGDANASAYAQELLDNNGKPVHFPSTLYRVHYFISVHLYNTIILVQVIVVTIWAAIRLVRYKNRLGNFFSNLEGKSLNHARAVLVGLFIFLLLSLIAVAKGRYQLSHYPTFISILLVLAAGVIYYLNYHVSNTEYTADNLAIDLARADQEASELGIEESSEENSSLFKDGENKQRIPPQIHTHLTRLINEEQIYLQKNLRIDDLVRLTYSNRTYISRLINEKYQCNFSDYINRKRVEYAQDLMRKHPNMSQEQIADNSGFQNASSFSRIFKQHSGINFREYQRNIYLDSYLSKK